MQKLSPILQEDSLQNSKTVSISLNIFQKHYIIHLSVFCDPKRGGKKTFFPTL